MTEAEWLASDNPEAMLAWAQSPNVDPANREAQCEAYRRLSDRKLRLFACACAIRAKDGYSVSESLAVKADWSRWADGDVKPGEMTAREAAEYWCESGEGQATAALLRDIVGNPWRPVVLPGGTEIRCDSCGRENPTQRFADNRCLKCGRGIVRVVQKSCPWLTPDVLALANAAYEERVRKCGNCKGAGKVKVAREPHPRRITVAGITLPTMAAIENWPDEMPCHFCKSKGMIDDGTLDPFTLAVLSDALEQAGCDSEELLTHLRSPGPHVRDCWALDLILGKE